MDNVTTHGGAAHGHAHDHALVDHHEDDEPSAGGRADAFRRAAGKVYVYAFQELLDDTSYWLILGIVLSGVVAAALPASLLDQYMGNSFLSMLIMLLIGIPIYTCASASTPLAAQT